MNRLSSILPNNSLNFFFLFARLQNRLNSFFAFRFFPGFSSSFYCAIETDLHAFNFYLVTQDCYCHSIVVHFHCIIIFYFVVRLRYDYKSNIFLFRILPSTLSTVEFFNSFLFILFSTSALNSTGKQIAHAYRYFWIWLLENVLNSLSEVLKYCTAFNSSE